MDLMLNHAGLDDRQFGDLMPIGRWIVAQQQRPAPRTAGWFVHHHVIYVINQDPMMPR